MDDRLSMVVVVRKETRGKTEYTLKGSGDAGTSLSSY